MNIRKPNMNIKDRFDKISDYVLYYGYGLEEELGKFDLAVIEPAGHGSDSINRLKSTGTITIAYLSVMEIQPWSGDLKYLDSKDLLSIDGVPLKNVKYDTYIADLTSQRWLSIIMHKAGRLIKRQGFDGLFLDTIGDIELPFLPANIKNIQLSGAINLIEKLRQNFSSSLLIQNNGLEKLYQFTAGLVDGICWENPIVSETNKGLIERLGYISQGSGTKIFLILEDSESTENYLAVKKLAFEKGFLFYRAPVNYASGINKK